VTRRIAGAAVALHLFFVLLVATHARDGLARCPAAAPLVAASDLYESVTLANRNFGFFAPDVTGDLVVRCVLVDAAGSRRAWSFRPPNREMEIRLYSMTGHFSQDPDTRDLFARSWAVRAFNENPDAVRVEIDVAQHVLPTMAEFRTGRRMEERAFYATSFERR
jgi:hypothetical protein